MSRNYNNSIISKTINKMCDGRLTAVSGAPYTLTQTTNGSQLYFSPIDGNAIGLYDSEESAWDLVLFSEVSLSMSSLSSNTSYDIYAYKSGSSLALDATAWASDSVRSVGLVRLDGVLTKSGASTHRYIGSIRTSTNNGLTVIRDTTYSRHIWNYYNQQTLHMSSVVTGFNNYSTRSWRPYNNNTTVANNGARVDFICGTPTQLNTQCHFQARYAYAGVGLNSSSPLNSSSLVHDNSGYGSTGRGGGIRTTSSYTTVVAGGFHYLQLCQYGLSGYSGFWIGSQSPFIIG